MTTRQSPFYDSLVPAFFAFNRIGQEEITLSKHRRMFTSLAFILPGVVWADINRTATLNTGQGFNFDTGSVVTSGGDLQFTGSSITYQGSAKGG